MARHAKHVGPHVLQGIARLATLERARFAELHGGAFCFFNRAVVFWFAELVTRRAPKGGRAHFSSVDQLKQTKPELTRAAPHQ